MHIQPRRGGCSIAGEPTMRKRMTRVESRLDGMAQDIDVLKADVSELKGDVKELKHDMIGVKQELRSLSHRIDVVVEHVDDGFRRQAELLHAMDEKHERRAAEYETRHYREMDLLRAVLGDHAGRIQRLEDAAGRSG